MSFIVVSVGRAVEVGGVKSDKIDKANAAAVMKALSISWRRSLGQTSAVLVAEEGLNVRLK